MSSIVQLHEEYVNSKALDIVDNSELGNSKVNCNELLFWFTMIWLYSSRILCELTL